LRYWRVGIGFDIEKVRDECGRETTITKSFEKVDMVGTVLSTEMVRPRLLSIPVFTIRMNEDLYVKGFSNSSITFNLLNHDGIYDNRFKGGEEVWVEVDGRKIYTGNVSLTPGGHPNIFPVTVDTNLLGFDEEVNLKIKASEYPNVPTVNEGNFGNIIGGTVSDESDTPSLGMIPCYRIAANKYLLAWHPCYALLGVYKEDGTDIYGDCTLLNDEDERAYITYTGTDVDVIWANAQGMISPEITFTKDADADTSITITLTLHECREVIIHWGDTNETNVVGPVTNDDSTHIYGDTDEYDIEILGDVRHLGKVQCRNEPISGNINGFESLGEDCKYLILDRTSISGDILAVSHLRNLEVLYLYESSVSGSISSFVNMISMIDLRIQITSISGNVSSLSGMTSLQLMRLQTTSITGNISSFSAMTNLILMYIFGTTITGNISSLSALNSLEYVRAYTLSLSGDISNLSGMTSMIQLLMYNNSLTGNISNLSGMTSLTILQLQFNSSLSGDVSSLAGLTSLTILYLHSTSVTYTTTTLPSAWDNCNFRFDNCGWTTNIVNAWLIDMDTASTASTKSMDISGTNQAPSGPGITAKNSLIAKGWTVTTS
jgi:hypothetical protein